MCVTCIFSNETSEADETKQDETHPISYHTLFVQPHRPRPKHGSTQAHQQLQHPVPNPGQPAYGVAIPKSVDTVFLDSVHVAKVLRC